LWVVLLRQLRNPVIGILVIAAALSLAIGHLTDAGFIAFVVVLNTLIGGLEEHRAERSARSLQQLLRTCASVVRDGDIREIDAEAVVPGDVVWLEPGNRVPADVRLLATHGLQIDESLLTGESLPVLKDATGVLPEPTPVADRTNMGFAGSMVVRGRAKGIVAATAKWTEVGALALEMMEVPAGRAPLLVRLARFTRMVGIVVLLAALVIGVLGVTLGDFSVTDMFLFAVALAVSAIPEGLPVAITVALAVAANRMARRGVIVRELDAVEGLGSCTMIASDKTGTLTCNELTVRHLQLADGRALTVEGEGFAPHGRILLGPRVVERGELPQLDRLMMAAVLCNEADLYTRDDEWAWRGDPTDVALLSMAHKVGWIRQTTLDEHPQVNQIAFEPEHRFAASYHRVDHEVLVFVKGGPERVLDMCAAQTDADWLRRRQAEAEALAERGFRVLAIAEGAAPAELDRAAAPPTPAALQLLGYVGMIDPLRPEVIDAVQACRRAGIGVCMVTGDHPVTAQAIARDLGLVATSSHVVTGADLAGFDADELRDRVSDVRVFARVAPRQKLDIVNAAQQAGHFVAVTGDGVNDAPALRAANIGVAMGRSGTDVAREASDLVISDDHFATIVAGVEEGRVAYDNIRKVVYLLVSTGAAEVVLVALAVATGSPLPLLPAQLHQRHPGCRACVRARRGR
jgi:magnesium-transporting ATPase (P-type)